VAARTTVTAPDGRVWTVTRRWARGPRWRGRDDLAGWLDALSTIGDASLAGIVIWLAALVVLGLAILILLPAILFVAELAVIAAGVYMLGTGWAIEAETAGSRPERMAWRVRGWRRAHRAQREVGAILAQGGTPRPQGAEALR
jgi:hypothetical protein